MCTYHLGNGISKRYRLEDDIAVRERASQRARWHLAQKKKGHDSTDREHIDHQILNSQFNQATNSEDDDNMEQEGTYVKNLGNSSDPDLPEDAEQARETDQAECSKQGANDTDHEDSLRDSDQAVMDIDSDEAASNHDQDESEKSFQTATDVNDSLELTQEHSQYNEQCTGTPHRTFSLAMAMREGYA